MLPALAIALFFILGVAFFAISSKDDFGITNLKNSIEDNQIENNETTTENIENEPNTTLAN